MTVVAAGGVGPLLLARVGPVPEEATTATDSAAALPILRCMPTALVTLRLPIEEGFALEHEGGKANAATVDCLLSLFRGGALKSPLAFDRAYAAVFAFHEEDGTRTLALVEAEATAVRPEAHDSVASTPDHRTTPTERNPA